MQAAIALDPEKEPMSGIRRAQEEHERLRGRIDRVRLLCGCVPSEATRRSQWLRRELQTLRDRMVAHFEFEEADGYMSELVERRPGLTEAAGRLLDEHAAILDALDAAVRTSSQEFEAMVAASLTALELFDRHEQAEIALFQSAYEDDLGGED